MAYDYQSTGEVQPPVNVLASRYASPEMVQLFSDDAKVVLMRHLWVDVMEQQAALGLDIPADAIEAYKGVVGFVDHASIRERERVSGHDVNAQIEEFNHLAGGHQYINRGMTSRDSTENVEQFQIREGLGIIESRIVTTLAKFASRALEYSTIPMAGRSHNVPAQVITLGKRFANPGEELLLGYQDIHHRRETYPLRGVKGPVGTQQDMLDLFEGDEAKLLEMEARIAHNLGFRAMLGSVGQVYPRSLDLKVVNTLHESVGGPASFAKTLRLMAGNELVTEGFKEGQVGSNAMPHKMNARTAERINSLQAILAGNAVTAGHLNGDQWNEGDVSCSAARRIVIPDSFFSADGVFQATLNILDSMGAYPEVINRELERYLPFLTTTKVLQACVKSGMGREDAHKTIKKHAVAVALEMREEGTTENDLFDRLANDPSLPVTKEQLLDAIGNPMDMTGLAEQQIVTFVEKVGEIVRRHPEATEYQAEPVL